MANRGRWVLENAGITIDGITISHTGTHIGTPEPFTLTTVGAAKIDYELTGGAVGELVITDVDEDCYLAFDENATNAKTFIPAGTQLSMPQYIATKISIIRVVNNVTMKGVLLR